MTEIGLACTITSTSYSFFPVTNNPTQARARQYLVNPGLASPPSTDKPCSLRFAPVMAARLQSTWTLLLLAVIICIAVIALAISAAASGLWYLNRPIGPVGARVEIEAGMTARHIGDILARQGLIRSAFAFEWLARFHGTAHQLEAGIYELSGSSTTEEILRKLLKAPLQLERLTVPEGLTRHQTAGLIANRGLVDSSRFLTLTENEEFIERTGLNAPNLEGYLFPETYFIESDATEEEIIAGMVAEFFRVFADSLFDRLEAVDMSLHQAVTLASMIELEAVVGDERPIISSIFQRRLKFDRRLESCATVEYALGVHKKRLTNRDLKVDSPYNTYIHRGPPPGPIGSPGRASILAALFPADADSLYFVARGDGTHTFSRTNKEHEAAKRTIRREQRRSRLRSN